VIIRVFDERDTQAVLALWAQAFPEYATPGKPQRDPRLSIRNKLAMQPELFFVGLLNELEERGLIVRRRDPADRRRHIVELSRLGVKELAAAYDLVSLVEDDVLGALSAGERVTLYRLLQQALNGESPSCTADEPLAPS